MEHQKVEPSGGQLVATSKNPFEPPLDPTITTTPAATPANISVGTIVVSNAENEDQTVLVVEDDDDEEDDEEYDAQDRRVLHNNLQTHQNRIDDSHLLNHHEHDEHQERKSSISFDKIKQISLTYSFQSEQSNSTSGTSVELDALDSRVLAPNQAAGLSSNNNNNHHATTTPMNGTSERDQFIESLKSVNNNANQSKLKNKNMNNQMSQSNANSCLVNGQQLNFDVNNNKAYDFNSQSLRANARHEHIATLESNRQQSKFNDMIMNGGVDYEEEDEETEEEQEEEEQQQDDENENDEICVNFNGLGDRSATLQTTTAAATAAPRIALRANVNNSSRGAATKRNFSGTSGRVISAGPAIAIARDGLWRARVDPQHVNYDLRLQRQISGRPFNPMSNATSTRRQQQHFNSGSREKSPSRRTRGINNNMRVPEWAAMQYGANNSNNINNFVSSSGDSIRRVPAAAVVAAPGRPRTGDFGQLPFNCNGLNADDSRMIYNIKQNDNINEVYVTSRNINNTTSTNPFMTGGQDEDSDGDAAKLLMDPTKLRRRSKSPKAKVNAKASMMYNGNGMEIDNHKYNNNNNNNNNNLADDDLESATLTGRPNNVMISSLENAEDAFNKQSGFACNEKIRDENFVASCVASSGGAKSQEVSMCPVDPPPQRDSAREYNKLLTSGNGAPDTTEIISGRQEHSGPFEFGGLKLVNSNYDDDKHLASQKSCHSQSSEKLTLYRKFQGISGDQSAAIVNDADSDNDNNNNNNKTLKGDFERPKATLDAIDFDEGRVLNSPGKLEWSEYFNADRCANVSGSGPIPQSSHSLRNANGDDDYQSTNNINIGNFYAGRKGVSGNERDLASISNSRGRQFGLFDDDFTNTNTNIKLLRDKTSRRQINRGEVYTRATDPRCLYENESENDEEQLQRQPQVYEKVNQYEFDYNDINYNCDNIVTYDEQVDEQDDDNRVIDYCYDQEYEDRMRMDLRRLRDTMMVYGTPLRQRRPHLRPPENQQTAINTNSNINNNNNSRDSIGIELLNDDERRMSRIDIVVNPGQRRQNQPIKLHYNNNTHSNNFGSYNHNHYSSGRSSSTTMSTASDFLPFASRPSRQRAAPTYGVARRSNSGSRQSSNYQNPFQLQQQARLTPKGFQANCLCPNSSYCVGMCNGNNQINPQQRRPFNQPNQLQPQMQLRSQFPPNTVRLQSSNPNANFFSPGFNGMPASLMESGRRSLRNSSYRRRDNYNNNGTTILNADSDITRSMNYEIDENTRSVSTGQRGANYATTRQYTRNARQEDDASRLNEFVTPSSLSRNDNPVGMATSTPAASSNATVNQCVAPRSEINSQANNYGQLQKQQQQQAANAKAHTSRDEREMINIRPATQKSGEDLATAKATQDGQAITVTAATTATNTCDANKNALDGCKTQSGQSGQSEQAARASQAQTQVVKKKPPPMAKELYTLKCPSKPIKLKNLINGDETYDTLHNSSSADKASLCLAALYNQPHNQDRLRDINETLEQARDFIKQFYQSIKRLDSPAYANRLAEIEQQLRSSGRLYLKETELIYGAKLAWRNTARCIGRIQWSKLQVFDARFTTNAQEMFEAICNHIKYATNKGKLRSAITVFPERTKSTKNDWRIWNNQLIGYAGYRDSATGKVLGDPVNCDVTEVAQKLGWQGKGTRFDVLPLVLSAAGGAPQVFPLPEELVLRVKLRHPKLEWFAELGLEWYALPAVANMMLDVGGLQFTAAPFSGWYMVTEIGTRDLADPHRYNILEEVAAKMGLNTTSNASLWKDKALAELNYAVLHSYQAAGVTIVDHHTACETFMTHLQNEQRLRGGCPADWVWLVPPTSGSLTQVFHQEMVNYHLLPNYEYMEPMWKTYDWAAHDEAKKQERAKLSQRRNSLLAARSVVVQSPEKVATMSPQDSPLMGDQKAQLHNNELTPKRLRFKEIARAVKFTSKLFGKALSRRIKATILYATETGKSERFANKLAQTFSCAFNVHLMSMVDYDMTCLEHEALLLIVTSTFGNGDPPENGELFAKHLAAVKITGETSPDIDCINSVSTNPFFQMMSEDHTGGGRDQLRRGMGLDEQSSDDFRLDRKESSESKPPGPSDKSSLASNGDSEHKKRKSSSTNGDSDADSSDADKKMMQQQHQDDTTQMNIRPLSNVRFGVFALGSTAYPHYCAFGRYVDQILGELGAERITKCALGDELCGQEKAFNEWSGEIFKRACEVFCMTDYISASGIDERPETVWTPQDVKFVPVEIINGHETNTPTKQTTTTNDQNNSVINNNNNSNDNNSTTNNWDASSPTTNNNNKRSNSNNNNNNNNLKANEIMTSRKTVIRNLTSISGKKIVPFVVRRRVELHEYKVQENVQTFCLELDCERIQGPIPAGTVPATGSAGSCSPVMLAAMHQSQSTPSLQKRADSCNQLQYLQQQQQLTNDNISQQPHYQLSKQLSQQQPGTTHNNNIKTTLNGITVVGNQVAQLQSQSSVKGRFQPGDHIAVYAINNLEMVNKIIERMRNDLSNNNNKLAEQQMSTTPLGHKTTGQATAPGGNFDFDQVFTILVKRENMDLTPATTVASGASPSSQLGSGSETQWIPHDRLPITSVREALTRYLDITSPPNQEFLLILSRQTSDPEERKRLQQIGRNFTVFEEWKNHNSPNLATLLDEFKTCKFEPALITQIPLLKPRFYSVSGTSVALTVGVVRYKASSGELRDGLCSNYLLDVPLGTELYGYLRSAPAFHMPADRSTPMLLISAGTGIAPFRSFWQQRLADMRYASISGEAKPIFGRIKLYFGCRNSDYILYRGELEDMHRLGVISTIHIGFSRPKKCDIFETEPKLELKGDGKLDSDTSEDIDYYNKLSDKKVESQQKEVIKPVNTQTKPFKLADIRQANKKTYVQDTLVEDCVDIYQLIMNEGAHVYVCGDVSMADGVYKTLASIFNNHIKASQQNSRSSDQKESPQPPAQQLGSYPDEILMNLRNLNRYHEDIFGAKQVS